MSRKKQPVALVTGANGLIGANLVRELLHEGHAVKIMVRASSNLSSLQGLDVPIVYGDILQPETLVDAFKDCDYLYHCAAVFAYWGSSPEQLERIAVDGTLNVLKAARNSGIKRIVVTSSSVTMGSSLGPEVRDETCLFEDPDPPPYSLAKLAQEQRAFEFAGKNGLDLVAVCPTMSIGAYGQNLGPSNGIITTYLGDPFKTTFPGGCNLVSVRDIARGHILAMQKGSTGERYLLASENLKWSEIHGLISDLCGIPGPLSNASHAASYLSATVLELGARLKGKSPVTTRAQAKMVGRYYWYSHGKTGQLGYSPIPARQALAEAIAWLVTTPHISREVRTSLTLKREVYEARKNIQLAETHLA